VADLTRIIVVQGPFGGDPAFSAGERCLLDDAAAQLGVEILEISEDIGGLHLTRRVWAIIAQLKRHAITQPERFIAVLQSDTLPTRNLDVSLLLDGNDIAGRGQLRDGEQRFWPTWLAFDTEAPAIQKSNIAQNRLRGPATAKSYAAHRLIRVPDRVKYFDRLENPAKYHFEWCEPCWLHLNRVMISDDAAISAKLDAASRILGVDLPDFDPSITLHGPLPIFRPRVAFPQAMTPLGRRPRSETSPLSKKKLLEIALNNWLQEGKPLRTDAEVEDCYTGHCQPCFYYWDGYCTRCGCGIHGNEPNLPAMLDAFDKNRPLRNKIRIATEHCPIWKW